MDPLNRVAAATETDEGQAYQAFRELVLGAERRELEELDSRIGEVENGDAFINRHLVKALRRNSANSLGKQTALAEAMAEPVENALRASVQRGRTPLSEALFPVIGPSVRIYVNELFRSLTDQLNETIRNTTSFRRLWWRIEAKLAGKNYTEYLLLKTLNYRTDEIFVIQRNSGLLIEHLLTDHAEKRGNDSDANLVSGMLIAIREFVEDSFSISEEQSDVASVRLSETEETDQKIDAPRDEESAELGRFTFGGRQVYLESGPEVIVAVVIEGSPPAEFQRELQDIVADLHGDFGDTLRAYEGQENSLAEARPLLRRLLVSQAAEHSERGKNSLLPLKIAFAFLVAAILGLVAWNLHCAHDWSRVEAALRSEPGIEVLLVEDIGFHKRKVSGLRDPLARDPKEILEEVGGHHGKVEFAMPPFHSLDTPFAEQRENERSLAHSSELTAQRRQFATELANLESATELAREQDQIALTPRLFSCRFPTAGKVALKRAGNIWQLTGEAEEPLYSEIVRHAPGLPLSGTLETSGLINATIGRTQLLLEKIEATAVSFVSGGRMLEEDSQTIIEQLADDIIKFESLSDQLGSKSTWKYELHSPPLEGGSVEPNRDLQLIRLQIFRRLLVASGISSNKIIADGIADEQLKPGRIGVYLRVLEFPREPQY